MKEVFAFFIIQSLIVLNGNCLINGWLYEESENLFTVMDRINMFYNQLNEQDFREVVVFMSMRNDKSFGFTIAGFMPLRKSTLLSVRGLSNVCK